MPSKRSRKRAGRRSRHSAAQPGRALSYRPPRQHASSLGCLLGCLPTLLFIGLCAGFIMLSSQVMFRAFGPLDQALTDHQF